MKNIFSVFSASDPFAGENDPLNYQIFAQDMLEGAWRSLPGKMFSLLQLFPLKETIKLTAIVTDILMENIKFWKISHVTRQQPTPRSSALFIEKVSRKYKRNKIRKRNR